VFHIITFIFKITRGANGRTITARRGERSRPAFALDVKGDRTFNILLQLFMIFDILCTIMRARGTQCAYDYGHTYELATSEKTSSTHTFNT